MVLTTLGTSFVTNDIINLFLYINLIFSLAPFLLLYSISYTLSFKLISPLNTLNVHLPIFYFVANYFIFVSILIYDNTISISLQRLRVYIYLFHAI